MATLEILSTPNSEEDRTPTQAKPYPMPPRNPSSPPPMSPSSSNVSISVQSTPARPQTPTTPTAIFQSNSSPDSSEKRKGSKARDLLRRHYGMSIGPPQPTGKPTDPMDMDSPAFNAKAYYEQLITTSPLPALLQRENDLLTEIRELDSERQSLVYNHHHELIAASDTIGAVKARAEALEGDLDKLKAAFSEISRLTAQVTQESHELSKKDTLSEQL